MRMTALNFFLFVAFCFLGWGQVCQCQVFFGGECLDLESVKNFDVQRFMGTWYEYQKYPSDLEKGTKCNMDKYELKNDGAVTILKSSYNVLSRGYVEFLGTAANSQNGNFRVEFKDSAAAARSRFYVLDTDYTNYSLLYACTPITDNYHTKMVWIMTRTREPKADAVVKAFQALARNRLPRSYLKMTDQTGCTYGVGLIDKLMQYA